MSERLPAPAAPRTMQPAEDPIVTGLLALLSHPALAQNLGLTVLSRMALDEKLPAKERRRCGEVLAQLKLKAMELAAHVTGARERALRDQGITQGPTEVHVEQHNTRIEIVREGSRDWRTADGG